MRGHRRGSFGGYGRRGSSPYSSGGGGGNYRNFQITRSADRDGDVSMGGQQGAGVNATGPRSRFSPYLPPRPNRGGLSQARSPPGPKVGSYGASGPSTSAGMANTGDEMMIQSQSKWYRVTIPNGKRFDREWIMKTLQSLMTYPFTAIHFHLQGPASVFFVNDEQAAGELKKCSGRAVVPGQGNLKLILIVVPLREPPRLELTHETLPQLRAALERRFNLQTQSLDLSNLYNDAALNNELLFLPLSKPNVSAQIAKVLRENSSATNTLVELNISANRLGSVDPIVNLVALMPNLTRLNLSDNLLRTEQELDRLKRLKLTELQLSGNPMVDRFSDTKNYEEAVQKRFRMLTKLDGKEVSKKAIFEVDVSNELPATTQFSLGSDANFRQLVLAFLEQYYGLFDAEKVTEREKLLEAYHESARFSVSYFTNSLIDKQPTFREYQDDSRNLRRVMDTQRRRKLLKQGRLSVVSTLAKLPRTKHDPATMAVDILVAANTQLIFTVTGCFKEFNPPPASSSIGASASYTPLSPYRAFSRTFVAVPIGNGIAITNDILTLSNAPNAAYQRMRDAERTAPATQTPKAAPSGAASAISQITSATAGVTISTPLNVNVGGSQQGNATELAHTQLVVQFCAESGMNSVWSRKCLEENEWNYQLAAQNFQMLRSQGVIPPDAFVSS